MNQIFKFLAELKVLPHWIIIRKLCFVSLVGS